jgi:hypothetical protein
LEPREEPRAQIGRQQGICFEDIVAAIEGGGLLDEIEHPNADKYPGQRILVVFAKAYVYAVPYVRTPDGIFLKTAFPSRRLKARYFPGGSP